MIRFKCLEWSNQIQTIILGQTIVREFADNDDATSLRHVGNTLFSMSIDAQSQYHLLGTCMRQGRDSRNQHMAYAAKKTRVSTKHHQSHCLEEVVDHQKEELGLDYNPVGVEIP